MSREQIRKVVDRLHHMENFSIKIRVFCNAPSSPRINPTT